MSHHDRYADRKGNWIETTTGPFWPDDPRAEDIDIRSIAQALSNLCRFGGHSRRFYSVAQHSVHCAGFAPPHLKLAALLHDAAEAYLVDMPKPLKMMLPDYRALETKIERVVMRRFGVDWPMSSELKEIDQRKGEQLSAGQCHPWWTDARWPAPYEIRLPLWDPTVAREVFLGTFRTLARGHVDA